MKKQRRSATPPGIPAEWSSLVQLGLYFGKQSPDPKHCPRPPGCRLAKPCRDTHVATLPGRCANANHWAVLKMPAWLSLSSSKG